MLQRRQIRWPAWQRVNATTRPQPGQAGRTVACAPAAVSSSISRSTAGCGAWCPCPVSRSGCALSVHASSRQAAGAGAARVTAAATAAPSSLGSRTLISSTSRPCGSSMSGGGQCGQYGRPWRSRRLTARWLPQPVHRSRSRAHGWQHQSWPRRARLPRNGRSQRAHTSALIDSAPADRNATSSSPTTSGAGDRPSKSTAGRWTNAAASRRTLARPAATPVTTSRAVCGSSPGSALATRATISPTGSTRAWSASASTRSVGSWSSTAVTAPPPGRSGPVSGAAHRRRPRPAQPRRRPCPLWQRRQRARSTRPWSSPARPAAP